MLSFLIIIYSARCAQIVYTIDCDNNKTLNGLSGIISSSTGVFAVCPENTRVPSCYHNSPYVIINFNSIVNQSNRTNISLPITFITNASQVKIGFQQADNYNYFGFVNFTFDTRQPQQQLTSMVWDLNFFSQISSVDYLQIHDESKIFDGNFFQQYVNVSWIVYTDSRFMSALNQSQHLKIMEGDNFWIQLLIQVYTDNPLYNVDPNSYNITLDEGYIFNNLTLSTLPTIKSDESKKYNNIINITRLGQDDKKRYQYYYIQNYTFQYPYSVIEGFFTLTGKFSLKSIYDCNPQEYVFGTVQQLQDGSKSSQVQVGIYLSLTLFGLILIFGCYLFREQEKITIKPMTSEEQTEMEMEEKEVFRKFCDRNKNINFQEQQEHDNIPLV